MIFKASFDWTVKILTAAFCLFYFTFLFLGIFNFDTFGTIIFPLIMTLIVVGSYLWHVQSYEVTDGGIEIKRPIGSKLISFRSINYVKNLKKDDLGIVIRTFGNGGLFGFYGMFGSSNQGKITFYGTQQRNYVIVETDSKKYVLTPDEPLEFVKSLEQRVGVI